MASEAKNVDFLSEGQWKPLVKEILVCFPQIMVGINLYFAD